MNQVERLILEFYENDMVKFGRFTLKSGKISNHYFDLRGMVSLPQLMRKIALVIADIMNSSGVMPHRICGLTYSAIPLASILSDITGIPIVYVRKERKEHGTGKLIEGLFTPGDRVLLIDDVLTTGGSLKETATVLESAGMRIESAIVIVNRSTQPVDLGFPVHAVTSADQILGTIKQYVHPTQKRLKTIMQEKQTRLVLSADVTTQRELFDLISKVGPYICVLKTHIDILKDFDENTIRILREEADHYNFLILEDRKFADIGNTVKLQISSGVYKISEWADLVTVHGVSGAGVIDNIRSAAKHVGILLLAQMSNAGNLIDQRYTDEVIKMANENRDMVVGYICQNRLDVGFLHFTPGVNFEKASDNTDQRYRTPEMAIAQQGCDLIIVGRGIYEASNPGEVARAYKEQSWMPQIVRAKL